MGPGAIASNVAKGSNVLRELLYNESGKTLIFARTKVRAAELAEHLQSRGYAVEAMHRHCAEAERGVFIDELRTIWEQQQFLPRSPAGRTDASLKTLREARFNHHAGPIEKARRKSLALADKHLLWRFRSK